MIMLIQIQALYHSTVANRPKLVKLIGKYSAKKGKQTGANPLALRSSSTAAKAPKATPTGATLSQNPLEHQITLAKTLPSLSVPFFI